MSGMDWETLYSATGYWDVGVGCFADVLLYLSAGSKDCAAVYSSMTFGTTEIELTSDGDAAALVELANFLETGQSTELLGEEEASSFLDHWESSS